MDIQKIDRSFGVKLATGETCAPGVLINVNSSGEGRVASDTNSYYAHGIALTSGAGTKATGISQYVTCYRSATVGDVGVTLTKGAVVYMVDTGQYSSSAPGTIDQKVGFALDANTVFVDLDVPAA